MVFNCVCGDDGLEAWEGVIWTTRGGNSFGSSTWVLIMFISIGWFFLREWQGRMIRKRMVIAVSIIVFLSLLEPASHGDKVWPENNCSKEHSFLFAVLKINEQSTKLVGLLSYGLFLAFISFSNSFTPCYGPSFLCWLSVPHAVWLSAFWPAMVFFRIVKHSKLYYYIIQNVSKWYFILILLSIHFL